ncbi:hypothetical protein FJR45_07155 [Sulfurimonas sediminis]|uniref:Uncharacterized protein n=1 Tax=Sulfurimonas sediminis TaxID=2590020 RepID=A0A7M1B272_9BACT|nr:MULTISPECIES: hypothetical protein [Sulfurimonas]QOP43740.1 hypothetical protein FJR45_07155 [Sulfurimonas sediminis]UCM99312.1 hypothetical protein LCX93_07130 [Sulfurimonas sp. SWIR-19]
MQKAYNFAIFYFILFSLLLLLSSSVLFASKIGFTTEGVLTYYLGNETLFIAPKTPGGILKIVLPHIFAFGLFVMVTVHFLLFTHKKRTKELQLLTSALFILSFLEIFTPFAIINGFESLAFLKIFSFFFFEVVILYTLFILFKSILYD